MDKEIASSPSAPRNDRRGTVRNDTRGASVIEYIVLTIIVLSSLYVMYNTISRGIFGKHKVAGDAFAFGRQYDARRTTTCRQDFTYSQNGTPINGVFYDEDCYQTRLMRPLVNGGCTQGDFACEDVIKNSCISDYCNQ
ncbi:MAG: hypothetical protein HY209_03005 [Candidatus Omnitrophica bacterium]|nr:hypothetical protein [Candidatus Omnitrophota bacterium]